MLSSLTRLAGPRALSALWIARRSLALPAFQKGSFFVNNDILSPKDRRHIRTSAHKTASIPIPHMAAPASSLHGSVLSGSPDRYDGFIVDPGCLPLDPEMFASALSQSLKAWREGGVKGVWMRIPTTHAHCVGHAVDAGFEFHHAEKDYLMMTNWLPADVPSSLPPNASHQVGVGAFVVNEKRQVLVVQEKYGPLRGMDVWKFPTGLVLAGEDITEAAEREVLEETGIRARFDCILAMRQSHGVAFGKSDMFFLIALRPDPGQEKIVHQTSELVGACWMDLEEYRSLSTLTPLNHRVMAACTAYLGGTYRGLWARKVQTGHRAQEDLMMFGEEGTNEGRNEEAWLGLIK